MSKYGDYILFTDSTCDMPNDMAEDFDIKVCLWLFLWKERRTTTILIFAK